MTASLILLGVLLVVGCILYAHHRLTGGSAEASDPEATDASKDRAATPDDEGCCGMHMTCERNSLLSSVSESVEYFDDEELDRFAGRLENEYDNSEIEEFREILLTMPPDNIAAWARSLQLRGISLPPEVRDELLLIVGEARAARARTAV
ncbi:MAG: phospholipase [Muribaculaceae bacterium]|nr:phospholipase [Muribaculaceae bacterium]